MLPSLSVLAIVYAAVDDEVYARTVGSHQNDTPRIGVRDYSVQQGNRQGLLVGQLWLLRRAVQAL